MCAGVDIAVPTTHVKFAKRMPGLQPDVTVFLRYKNMFLVKRCKEKDENRARDWAVSLILGTKKYEVCGDCLIMQKGDCDYGL